MPYEITTEITTCPCCGQGNLLDDALPCPECGGRPSIEVMTARVMPWSGESVQRYSVECPRCESAKNYDEQDPLSGVSGAGDDDPTILEAIADWNEKAKDAPR